MEMEPNKWISIGRLMFQKKENELDFRDFLSKKTSVSKK